MSQGYRQAVARQTIRLIKERMKTDPTIMESICNTKAIQYEELPPLDDQDNPIPPLAAPVEIWDADTFDAAQAALSPTTTVCVLNMASEHRAGGGWQNGALAQEEALCYRSTLAAALDPNRLYIRTPTPIDHSYPLTEYEAIYSPDILVFRANEYEYPLLALPFKVDVVTMAAQRNPPLRNFKYVDNHIMHRKIEMLMRVPHACGFKGTLILGAWGCGVFGNPPKEVAILFRRAIKKYGGYYERIIFAIYDPGRRTGNYDAFRNVFSE